MSVYRTVRLFCNGRNPYCGREFKPAPELGFINSFAVIRAEAAKAGWTCVRWPHRRTATTGNLDQDYCPDHKPAPGTTPDDPGPQDQRTLADRLRDSLKNVGNTTTGGEA